MSNTPTDTLTQLNDTVALTDSIVPVLAADISEDTVPALTVYIPQAYESGIKGEPRVNLPGYDSGIMLLVLFTLIFAAFNIRQYSSLLKSFGQDLWSVRNRENAFDSHTLNETRIIMSLIAVLCVSEGIMMMCLGQSKGFLGNSVSFLTLLGLTAVGGLLYLFQYCSYSLVGYTFTNRNYANQWLRCFNATQAMSGLFFVIPALAVLFNPSMTGLMCVLCCLIYIGCRIIFIIKGFRIFYHNFFSLIYFILYLCTLEIVPLVLLYRCREYLSLF